MRAVAERLVAAGLAPAQPHLFAFGGGEFLRRQSYCLVRAVAEWLVRAAATGAPPIILPSLEIDAIGGLLRGNGFSHCCLFLKRWLRFNVAPRAWGNPLRERRLTLYSTAEPRTRRS